MSIEVSTTESTVTQTQKTLSIDPTPITIRAVRYGTIAHIGLLRALPALTGRKFKRAELPEPIGRGCYGYVFPHPLDSSKVIKVCWNSPRYVDYALYALEYSAVNPYLPRVESVRLYFNKAQNRRARQLAVVVMERLENSAIAHGLYRDLRDRFLAAGAGGDDAALAAVRAIVDTLSKMSGDTWLDIHDGNIMIRNGCEAVITDPVAG